MNLEKILSWVNKYHDETDKTSKKEALKILNKEKSEVVYLLSIVVDDDDFITQLNTEKEQINNAINLLGEIKCQTINQ